MAGRFGSVVTAMVTPFRDDHALDLDGARSLASWLIEQRLRRARDRRVRPASRRRSPTRRSPSCSARSATSIQGQGQAHLRHRHLLTAETLELTQAAEDAGADGLLRRDAVLQQAAAARAARALRRSVADATELPIIAYNIPGRTATRIEHDTLLRLAEVPNIVAREGLDRRLPGDLAADRGGARRTSRSTRATTGRRSATCASGAVGVVSVAGHLVGAADPPDDRPDRRPATSRRPARSTRSSRRCSTRCSSRRTRSRSRPRSR